VERAYFLAALFVMVGGLEASGVLESITGLFRGASSMQPVLFGVLLIWIVAAFRLSWIMSRSRSL